MDTLVSNPDFPLTLNFIMNGTSLSIIKLVLKQYLSELKKKNLITIRSLIFKLHINKYGCFNNSLGFCFKMSFVIKANAPYVIRNIFLKHCLKVNRKVDTK